MIWLKPSLWDSVHMKEQGVEIPTTKPFMSIFCSHKKTGRFVRTDSRGGPGWMSDSYEGTVCMDCGIITKEEKVY